jgi:hypothetical protein
MLAPQVIVITVLIFAWRPEWMPRRTRRYPRFTGQCKRKPRPPCAGAASRGEQTQGAGTTV